MSWESLVSGMLAEENPELNSQLLSDPSDEYEDYVTDVAKRMRESYETATAGVTDPTRRATAREVAIAQAREEIAPPELLEIGSPSDDAMDILRAFYGSGQVDE